MTGIAHRDVQLVRRDDPQLRVAKLPPVLMSDGGDLDGASGFGSILNGVDHSRRGQEQHNNNQNGNDRPGQLNLRAPVDLGRLAAGILQLARGT